ncbi:WRKY DNA-binding transcription factor 70 [Argentina anserina]|uniref:WRKY DNA-binding transcription factor 70 n=1 Tax=Argentina anserina TaxID=57926 RepID=UPI0021764B63|nr:WRKY DNA-binding transcription factor 70 [Potentilla anserina]
MATTWLEALPADHRRIIVNQLVHGQKRARELHSLLNNGGEDGSTSRQKEELVMEIVTSFTQSLSVLNESSKLCGGDDHHSGTTGCGGGEIVKAEQSHVEHSHCGDRNSEDSGESKKKPGLKDRRGCYKRRKNSESWTMVSSTVDDGQAWRKYGQKEILNAPYPRAYFRCTRKYDQGCQATKQVQQCQDTPKLYNTTYIGKHTCKNIIGAPQIIMGSHAPPRATVSSESGSTTAICNEKEHNGDHGGYPSISSSMIPFIPVKKEECKEGTTSSDLTDNLNNTSNMWPEMDFGFPETTVMSSMEYLDMDLELEKSISFEKFDFDEVVFT